MKFKRGLILGLAVVLLSNAIVLARVAYNRSGEPDIFVLSERELQPIRTNQRENSGLALRLTWVGNSVNFSDEQSWRWFNRRNVTVEKMQLEELNFPTEHNCGCATSAPNCRVKRSSRFERKAWVALEYNGPAYQQYLEQLENYRSRKEQDFGPHPTEESQKQLESLDERVEKAKYRESRLYAVDIAAAREPLEKRYAYSGRHLILQAVVNPQLSCEQPVTIYISKILTELIYVPRPYRKFFRQFEQNRFLQELEVFPFNAQIAYGKLAEPWLTRISVTR